MIFSSNEAVKSLEQRNEAMEAYEPDAEMMDIKSNSGIYLRRKKRLEYLYHKESEQIKILDQLRESDCEKFVAIIDLLKYFSKLKEKVKVEYYSHKTFCAIKSSSAEEINKLRRVLNKIYNEAKEGYEEN